MRDKIIELLGGKCRDCNFNNEKVLCIIHNYPVSKKLARAKYYTLLLTAIKEDPLTEAFLLCMNCEFLTRNLRRKGSTSSSNNKSMVVKVSSHGAKILWIDASISKGEYKNYYVFIEGEKTLFEYPSYKPTNINIRINYELPYQEIVDENT